LINPVEISSSHDASFPLLNVDYNAMVAEPGPIVAEIDLFLGGGLDIDAMASTVDASLYRNRAE
jgi:hypothetical protein